MEQIRAPLPAQAIEWLEKERGISAETADRYGVSICKGALTFPYIHKEVFTHHKYRTRDKSRMWQDKDPFPTFWNGDVLDDPAVVSGEQAVLITEGELDALAAIEAGYPFAMSVPNGGTKQEGKPEEVDDEHGAFRYVGNNAERLKGKRRFILALDEDEVGHSIRDRLLVLLLKARCSFVVMPAGCKDINDVLLKHGPDAVMDLINNAKPYPIGSVKKARELPKRKAPTPWRTGFPTLDKHMGIFPGAFAVCTGVPSHGKTTLMTQICVNMARLDKVKSLIYSPEMPVQPYLYNKLSCQIAQLPLYRIEQEPSIAGDVDEFIDQFFTFVEEDDDDPVQMSVEELVKKCTEAYLRFGIDHFLLDPWNEIEHAKPAGVGLTEYINYAVAYIKRHLCRKLGVAVTVIAHPTKAVGNDGETRVPTLYDVEGSAAWNNKPDIGLIVHILSDGNTMVRIQKIRHEDTGEKGDVFLKFKKDIRSFAMLDETYRPPGYDED